MTAEADNDLRDCEDCEQGKHQGCLIEVWDPIADDWAACPCKLRGHGPTFGLSHEKRQP